MIKTVIFFFLMICPKFTRLSDWCQWFTCKYSINTYTDHKLKKSKAKRRINKIQLIRVTASKCNLCVIDNKNYAVKKAKG